MPVWVTGNMDSDVMIIITHGGLGGTSGFEFPISKGFKDLEKLYKVVYWDQRMSGMTMCNAQHSDLSIAAHVEDQGKLVDLILDRYSPSSLFLMGHSWGGVLTAEYLGERNNQDLFKGWIDCDGSLYDVFEGEAKKKWIMDRMPDYYDKDPDFYQYIIDWYEAHPNPVENDWQLYTYVSSMDGYAYNWEKTQQESPIPYFELITSSPYTFAFYFAQYTEVIWVNGFDAREKVKNIEIPTLFLWGKEDGAVPTSVAYYADSIIGTPDADKEIVLIDSCAHSPYYDRPDTFVHHMTRFVEKYK